MLTIECVDLHSVLVSSCRYMYFIKVYAPSQVHILTRLAAHGNNRIGSPDHKVSCSVVVMGITEVNAGLCTHPSYNTSAG